jgi:hypothetical protein
VAKRKPIKIPNNPSKIAIIIFLMGDSQKVNEMSSNYVKGMKSKKWTPISISELQKLIELGISKMSIDEIDLWNKFLIKPTKWKEVFNGEEGNGFWVVAIFDNKVIWYNDIEEGFNISTYIKYGEIDEYCAEQDELQWTIKKIINATKLPK